MRRVLLVSASAVPGGAERALASLARRLPENGIATAAVLLQDGPLAEWLRETGCPMSVIQAGRTRQLHRTVRAVSAVQSAARASSAEAIVSCQSKSHVYGGFAAWLAGVPGVWWQQGIPSRSRIEFVAGRVPAAAVVCSSGEAVRAQQRLTPARRVALIPLGVDVTGIAARRGDGQELRRRLGWERRRVVGIVGRLQPWKGQETFLRAAALVAATRPHVRFAIVGGAVLGWEGTYPDHLRRLAAEIGLGERVHFAGHQDDPMPWFDAFDVAVHASFGEPFGLVLVEAMALGKPLVASADGGPAEIVEHGVSGILVPPGEPEAFAHAIGRLLDDEQLARRLGESAAARAREFSDDRTAARFAELLADLVAPRRAIEPAGRAGAAA